MAYYVETIRNRRGRDTVLLRQNWREGKRIRKKTIANLTDMPAPIVHGIDAVVRGGTAFTSLDQAFAIVRAWPHGHVAAALGTARQLGLERILDRHPSRPRSLALATLLSQLLMPDSKLGTSRRLSPDTAQSSLGEVLGLGAVSGNELLSMLDWLLGRQRWIERSLANRHLHDATLILYDVTSSYVEGRACPLAAFGYSRDRKRGKKQIVLGMLCAADGCPIAVEVFDGNTADPKTVAGQVRAIEKRFGIDDIALVGDRGMLTSARIREDVRPAGLDWISALPSAALRKLLDAGTPEGRARLERLERERLIEVASEAFPNERIVLCLNPRLRRERSRKRQDLLTQTEQALQQIAESVDKGKAVGAGHIGKRVGAEAKRWKVLKHFDIRIGERQLAWQRLDRQIEDEARLDGVYAIRTGLAQMPSDKAVLAYKSLSRVERAFRSTKSILNIRPMYVYTADHVRAHVFLCMLAYYVEWHMRQRLAPLLFEDDDPHSAAAARRSPVDTAQLSDRARAKAATRKTVDGHDVHSFRSLLDDLSTLTLNKVSLPGRHAATVPTLAQPTPLQTRAFELLGVDPQKHVPSAKTAATRQK